MIYVSIFNYHSSLTFRYTPISIYSDTYSIYYLLILHFLLERLFFKSIPSHISNFSLHLSSLPLLHKLDIARATPQSLNLACFANRTNRRNRARHPSTYFLTETSHNPSTTITAASLSPPPTSYY